MRSVTRVVVMTLVGLAACIDSTAPKSGEMSLAMPASPGILDSGHVVLTGPTPKTVTLAPGATVTISGLDPGTYTVGLVGFYGGGAAYSAQVSGVSVVAGQNTTPAVPALVASFGVTVSPTTGSIAPGATQQFTAVAKDAQNNTLNLTFFWASSNQNAALVDQTGLATGVGGGTATISALGLGVPGSAALTVTGGASQLVFTTAPSSSTAGAAISPAIEVELQDANGGRVTSARNPVTLTIGTNPGGGTLLGSTTVNAVNGVASFSGVAINKVGTGYTLIANAGSLPAVTATAFNIGPGPAAKLSFTTQPPTTGEGNVVFSPGVGVTILDQFDNVTSSTNAVTIVLQNSTNLKAVLRGTTTANAVAGVATFGDLRIVEQGSGYSLQARSGTLPIAASSDFAIALTFLQISSSYYHNCAVTPGGVYCWGNNDNGQLGEATVITDCFQVPFSPCENVPVLVQGSAGFTRIAVGSSHSCALDTAGAIWCWGYNGFGQLGDGTTTNHTTPAKISGTQTFADVVAGYYHTCGLATGGGGAVWCWGYNGVGQLGDGSPTQRTSPVQVLGSGTSPLIFATISAGGYNTCGINGSGAAYCWGSAASGALGDNDAATNKTSPNLVSPPTAGAVTYKTSAGSISVGKLAGGSHVCAMVIPDSRLFCWGRGTEGQIGNGTPLANQLIPVQGGGSLLFSAIASGYLHTCGVTTSNEARCWGSNGSYQVGDGTNTQRNTPVLVSTTAVFTSFVGGASHSCAITAGGLGFCWGDNSYGELGNGNNNLQTTPVAVKQR